MRRKLLNALALVVALFTATIAKAETTEWQTAWTTDFSTTPTGISYSAQASTSIDNGYLELLQGGGSGARWIKFGFDDTTIFGVETDWKLEFDWGFSYGNTNAGSYQTFATNNGNAFTITETTKGSLLTITDASDNTLNTTTLPYSGYNTSTCSAWSHFVVTGVVGEGVYLTVTDNADATLVDNVLVTDTYGYPSTFDGSLARAVEHVFMDNITFYIPYVAGFVSAPTITATGVSGEARTVILESLTSGASIKYTTTDPGTDFTPSAENCSDWTEYSSAFSTTDATLYAVAYDADGNYSDVATLATGAGSAVTLNQPTISATAYSDGAYTITLSSDQSSVELSPTATLVYTIDNGTEQEGTSVSLAEGSTITVYAKADGYTNSETVTWASAARPTGLTTIWTQDYTSLASDLGAGTGAQSITIGSDVAFSVDGTDFYNITGCAAGDVDVTTNVGLNSSSYISLRSNGNNSGILFQSGTRYLGIQNLEVGQTIVITCNDIVPTASYGATLEDGMSVTGEYYFTATATEASICIVKNTSYDYIYTITVLGEAATTESVTVTSAGYATYVTENAVKPVDGVTFYAVTNGDDYVTLTEVTAAPAGTPLLIAAAEGTYDLTVISEADAVTTDLQAATEDITCNGTQYVLAEVNGTVGFYKAQSGTVLATGKCYLVDETSTAAAKTIRIDGDVTGVAEVVAAAETVTDGAAYNLAGQKVSANAKGIVIINGKKYINK